MGIYPSKFHLCILLSHFSRVRLFVTPWTAARQAPLSMGILQARTLEWAAMPSSRGSSRPRGQTCVSYVSCFDRKVLFQWHNLGSPKFHLYTCRNVNPIIGRLLKRAPWGLDCWRLSRSLGTRDVWKNLLLLCFPVWIIRILEGKNNSACRFFWGWGRDYGYHQHSLQLRRKLIFNCFYFTDLR